MTSGYSRLYLSVVVLVVVKDVFQRRWERVTDEGGCMCYSHL